MTETENETYTDVDDTEQTPDVAYVDLNDDGQVDAALVDLNDDAIPDVAEVDLNGDLVPEAAVPLAEPPSWDEMLAGGPPTYSDPFADIDPNAKLDPALDMPKWLETASQEEFDKYMQQEHSRIEKEQWAPPPGG